LAVAAQAMWDADLGCLPVVDDSSAVVGMLTDRDLAMATHLRGAPPWALAVSDAMARTVYTARPDDKLRAAARLMTRYQLRRLPVVDGAGKLVGMLTLTALAQASLGKGKKKSSLSAKDVMAVLCAVASPRTAPVVERLVVEVTREPRKAPPPPVEIRPAPPRAAKRSPAPAKRKAKPEKAVPARK
jgi:CBS domain-containing protein